MGGERESRERGEGRVYLNPPRAWSRTLFGLVLGFGALFSLVTPPFQVPDERAHFYRAFGVSEGRLFLDVPEGGRGLWLPESLTRVLRQDSDELPFHPERKIQARAIVSALAVRLEPGRRVLLREVDAGYSFFLYLPQALGMAIARLFSDSVLVLFYAGRLAATVASAWLFATAAKRAIGARPLFFVLALPPMTVFLSASFSADAMTNGLTFLFIGTVLGWSAREGRALGTRDLAHLALLCLLLGFLKPAYVPLAALVLFVPAGRFGSPRRRWTFCATAMLTAVLSMLAWTASVAWRIYRPLSGVASHLQASGILAEPLGFAALAVRYYCRSAWGLAKEYVGIVGWLDTPLPVPVLAAILLTLVFVAATCGSREARMSFRQRTVLLIILASSVVWLTVLLYLFLSPVGSTQIHSTQGRYFIPVIPLFLLVLHNERWIVSWERYRPALAVWCGTWLACALVAVVFRYYI
jgi:hypothetical protein